MQMFISMLELLFNTTFHNNYIRPVTQSELQITLANAAQVMRQTSLIRVVDQTPQPSSHSLIT